jgi:AAA ATPase domain
MPAELAGREEVLEDLLEAIEVAAHDGRMPRPTLLVGTRGVGKTVLLSEAAAIAGSRFGWPRVHAEIRPDTPFTPDLVDAIGRACDQLRQPRRKRPLRAETMTVRAGLPGVGGEIRFARVNGGESDPTAVLRPALTELAELMDQSGSGVVLTLDEAHLASRSELAALAALLQEGTGERWPLVVVLAGLPLMRNPERSVTYLERGAWHELGLLNCQDAARALRRPAEAAGRQVDDAAIDLLAQASGGYPYAVQLYGHHAWRASLERERIDLAAAEAALPRVQKELERGLYAARWAAASPMQRQYLVAIATVAAHGQPATTRNVAAELGRQPKQLSTVRDDLLKQGTLTTDDGELRFTIPGMSAYVLAR